MERKVENNHFEQEIYSDSINGVENDDLQNMLMAELSMFLDAPKPAVISETKKPRLTPSGEFFVSEPSTEPIIKSYSEDEANDVFRYGDKK